MVLLVDGVRHSWPICTAYTQIAGPPKREVRVSLKELQQEEPGLNIGQACREGGMY